MNSLLIRLDREFKKLINYHRNFPNKFELITLLNNLDINEKCFIIKMFCNYEWNVGSVRLLSILQECQILSATEYILSQDDEKHIQLVLYDFLETEYILLAHLIENLYYNEAKSLILKPYLEDCFRQLIRDAIENPETVISTQYLHELKETLSEKLYKNVVSMHLDSLLKLENTSVYECFVKQKDWNDSIEKNLTLKKLINELIINNEINVLNEVIQKLPLPIINFKGWKYFLFVLRLIFQQQQEHLMDLFLIIKKYLKDLFKIFVSKTEKELLYIIFIIARTVYSDNNKNSSETYSSWFKSTIGEMKYSINNTENFKYVMSILIEMIKIENDPHYIQIYINTAINPPAHCNDLVLYYKKLCKKRLSTLMGKNKPDPQLVNDVNEILVIDDEDDDDYL